MKRKILFKTLIILLGIALIYYAFRFFKDAANELAVDPVKMEKTLPDDYLSLFSPEAKKRIKVKYIGAFKRRSNIAVLTYSDKYNIEISKFKVINNFTLQKDIVRTTTATNEILPKINFMINEDYFRINYNAGTDTLLSRFFLTLKEDSTSVSSTNNCLIYKSSKLKSIRIQFKKDGYNELMVDSKQPASYIRPKTPISLIFYKNNNTLYTIIMTTKNKDDSINVNGLFNFTSKV